MLSVAKSHFLKTWDKEMQEVGQARRKIPLETDAPMRRQKPVAQATSAAVKEVAKVKVMARQ